MSSPHISVVIVNYNGGRLLSLCLDALRKQTIHDFEIIIVDNGSSDGSLGYVDQGRDKVIIHKLEYNTGFAAANNRGAELAKGEWLVLLNNDAFPRNDWLEKLLGAATKYPDFKFFGSHQYNHLDRSLLDGTGDIYICNGSARRRDYKKPAEDGMNHDDEVFGVCAAAAMYRKSCFDEVGGFDEDYFCYFEDVDLSFRLRLAGYRCMHVADAVVYHIGAITSGGEEGNFAIYHGYRNLVWTYFKCMPFRLMIFYLSSHMLLNAYHIYIFIRQGKGKIILRAKWDAITGLPRMLVKRRRIQAICRVDENELGRVMKKWHLIDALKFSLLAF